MASSLSAGTLAGEEAAGQKTVIRDNQLWFGYVHQTRLSKHWGLYADAQYFTRNDFTKDAFERFVSGGPTYFVGDNLRLIAGYTYTQIYPFDGHPLQDVPEHRPWQQAQWFTNYTRLRLMQWFRVEERFRRKTTPDQTLATGYTFNGRVRYNFQAQWSFAKNPFAPGTFSLVVNNEAFVNFGRIIVNNYFDQNRFFAGAAWHIAPNAQLHIGYLNVFQQMASGNQYRSIQAGRAFLFHSLDFRKKAGISLPNK